MPQPLSSLKKGIKFESTLGTENAPLLENLTLTLVGETDMLATTTGGALLTVNPDKQTTAKTVTLIEGSFVDIALEFNGAGLFRVKVTPRLDIPTVSAWMPEQTEHNIGVSYNTTLGQIVIAVDGASILTNADFSGLEGAVNLRVAAAGNGAAAGPGTYDGFIDQLAFFKTAPTVAQIERMTANPDLLRTDFANLSEVPTVTGTVQGLSLRSETQTVVLTGTATAAGTVSFLGTATAAVAINATATVVGDAIVAAKAAIIAGAGNTFGVTDITNNAGTLTLTFNSSLGNVAAITASAVSNGVTFAAGTEVIAGLAPISETQTVVIAGPATAAGVVSYLGVDSTPLVAGSLTINDVGNAIVTNKAAILAGTAAKAANITDISNNAGTLTLTYSRDAGDVAAAAVIAAASNGVTFAAGTEVIKGQTGTPEAHTLTFAGKYRAGDVISIAAGIDSAATETKNYTVLGSDIKSTDALTQQAVAASINTTFASKVGSFTLANPINTNTVTFTGKASAGNLVDPVTTFTGAGGLIENVVLDYFDFTKIAISTNSVTGPGGGTATFLNGKATPTANAVVSQDYVGTSTSTTTSSTTVLPTNGPVYARLKSYTVPAGTTAPELKYEFFVNKSADITGALTSLGFSLDFDETKATYKSFVAGSGATLQQVNTLDAVSSGKIVYQWVATTGQTDLSLPVGELTVTMAGAAPYVPSVGMTMSDISINNVFYRQTGTALPLIVDTKLDAERYTATGWVKQMFTPLATTTTPQVSVAQGGTVVSYEVFGAQINSAVRLDVQDNFVPTSAASPNANIKVDVIANQALASFSLVVNLPSNATGATFTAGAGMTLTKNVVNGTQLSIAGTYVAPATGASATPTIGTVSLNLVGQHGNGSDFTISDLTVNNTVSVGRSLFFGIAQTDSNGLLSVANLPKGDMVTNVFDNPVAPSSKITIEDARAVLLMASGKNNGATAAATGNAWMPSDFIAADWDKNGVVTASDALAILNYVVAVDKSGTQLDYVYIDNALNTQAKTPQKVSSVVVPPIAKILTNKSSDLPPVDYAFGGGHTDVQFVGILVGDLVQ